MKALIAPALILTLQASPLAAQEAPGFWDRGMGLIERFFRDAPPEAPSGDSLAQTLRQMGPILRDMAAQVDDIRNYQMPERLPNGDILIRRREGAPPPPPLPEGPATGPEFDGPSIEL